MKTCKKTLAIILFVLSIMVFMIGTTAVFTDRFTGTIAATTGELRLNLDDTYSSLEENLLPGQGVRFGYTLTNAGNKSADVLETIVISFYPDIYYDGTTIDPNNPEFVLYKSDDVILDSNSIATVKEGAIPLSTVTDTGLQLRYEAPEFILNGSGNQAETEIDGIDSKVCEFVLVFSKHASNRFETSYLVIDYEAQAKQHRNTNADTWSLVQSELVSFAGNDNHKTVPNAWGGNEYDG